LWWQCINTIGINYEENTKKYSENPTGICQKMTSAGFAKNMTFIICSMESTCCTFV